MHKTGAALTKVVIVRHDVLEVLAKRCKKERGAGAAMEERNGHEKTGKLFLFFLPETVKLSVRF